MSTDNKKPEDKVESGSPEILEGDELDELHGGAFSRTGAGPLSRTPGRTISVNDEFDTAYGGEGNDVLNSFGIGTTINPLKR